MKNLIESIKNLEKNDKTMLLLIITTIGNIIIAFAKFIFSFILPSLWFLVNACFLTVLSISRFFSIRNYGKMRNKEEKIKKE